jgi:sulfite exporter TauE/SafE
MSIMPLPTPARRAALMHINALRKHRKHGYHPRGGGARLSIDIPQLATLCGSANAAVGGMLLAGLAGGPMHCAPMCGGFVIGQVADRMARLPGPLLCEAARLRGALLLPYHVGRLTTYAAIGGIAGLVGSGFGRLGWFAPLSAGLLLLAATLLAGQAMRRLVPAAFAGWVNLGPAGRLTRLLRAGARRVGRARTDWGRGLLLGLLLVLLPCGLLYAALAAAAAAGDAAHGALAMAAFGLGTVPSLFGVGLAGHVAAVRGRTLAGRLAPALLLANAALLALLAGERIAAAL